MYANLLTERIVLGIACICIVLVGTRFYNRTANNSLNIPAIYINLDRRTDRLKHCTAQLNEKFSTLERYSAIEGKYVDTISEPRVSLFYDLQENSRWDKTIKMFRTRRMSAGEIGCCISHRNVWELARSRRYQKVAIFEDDVVVSASFSRKLRRALMQLPSNWDILYLGYINPSGLTHKVSSMLKKIKFVFGAYAYVLRDTGLRKLIAALPIDRPIDNFLGKLCEEKVLNAYGICPPIAKQIQYGGFGSDIVHSAHLK